MEERDKWVPGWHCMGEEGSTVWAGNRVPEADAELCIHDGSLRAPFPPSPCAGCGGCPSQTWLWGFCPLSGELPTAGYSH